MVNAVMRRSGQACAGANLMTGQPPRYCAAGRVVLLRYRSMRTISLKLPEDLLADLGARGQVQECHKIGDRAREPGKGSAKPVAPARRLLLRSGSRPCR